jgi:hypothetical protein
MSFLRTDSALRLRRDIYGNRQRPRSTCNSHPTSRKDLLLLPDFIADVAVIAG